MADIYIPPPAYFQNQEVIKTLKAETNHVSRIELTVADEVQTIIPYNNPIRRTYTIFHDTEGEELLIDFLHDPTVEKYAFSLPPRKLFSDDKWQGEIKAISRSGNPIKVHCREFKLIGGV